MSGIFGVVGEEECVSDVYYGTDYHSHLGKATGGMAVFEDGKIHREIKDISIFPFRPQLVNFKAHTKGNSAIGIISDYEPQPLILDSRLGRYALAHVGKINNLDELVKEAHLKGAHFSDMSTGKINPTEVVGSLVDQGKDYADGIEIAQNKIKGSSSIMILSKEGLYVARDKFGRTAVSIGKKERLFAATLESFVFNALDYETIHSLGPGEIGLLTKEGYNQIKKPEDKLQICSFLWVYYGNPAAFYEGVNSEVVRNKLGAMLAKRDKEMQELKIDFVAGVPDSGIGSSIGYSDESKIPLARPFVKYVETWQRSFMPQEQEQRDLVGKMKILQIPDYIVGKNLLLTDDSLVRGTQSLQKFNSLYSLGAKEVHLRLSCPPLIFPCEFLNFSRSASIMDLATRRAIKEIDGDKARIEDYLDEKGEKHNEMVERIKRKVGVTTLGYQRLNDMVSAIGIPKEKLCTYCWDGCDITKCPSSKK
ncbi:MAG: amidophosphoribosyltransferase [Candidatus Nanoarchaeia archaeon]